MDSPSPTTPNLPPAAFCTVENPPACKIELEQNWETSIASVWEKIRTTKSPTKEDWKALIAAERLNRMAWVEADEAGTRRKGKKAFTDLMGSKVVDGQLVVEAEVKKTRVKKEPSLKVPKQPRKPRTQKAVVEVESQPPAAPADQDI